MRPLLSCLAVALLIVAARPAAAAAVDLELVLAVDVSGSIDDDEAKLQRAGFVAAFRNEAVIRAITGGEHGRIAVLYMEWAGVGYEWRRIDWRVIDGKAASLTFAEDLAILAYNTGMWTSISNAIDVAMDEFRRSPHKGKRRVIDVSGDGANNQGERVTLARDRAVAAGVTINGLPIVNGKSSPYGMPQIPNLDWYFEDCVIGGPNAFIVVANGFEDFGRAIKRKLIREIAGLGGMPADPWRAQAGRLRHDAAARAARRPPCDAGEKRLWDQIDDT